MKIYMLLLAVLMSIVGASAATLTVDDSGGQDYLTIRDAVNNSVSGDTILVYPGTYHENIVITHSISIEGQTGNPEDVVIKPATFAPLFDMDCGDCSFSFSNVSASGFPYVVLNNGLDDNNIIVFRNNICKGNGIVICHLGDLPGPNIQLIDNWFEGNDAVVDIIWGYMYAENNTFYNNSHCIDIREFSINSLITGNYFEENDIGIFIDYGFVTVKGNQFRNNDEGLCISSFSIVTIIDNSFIGNHIGIDAFYDPVLIMENNIFENNHYAIKAYSVFQLTMSNNEIINNNNGIHFSCDDLMPASIQVSVFNNTIIGNEYGIYNSIPLDKVDYFTVYDNYFDNNVNFRDVTYSITWGSTNTLGSDIVKGIYTGGGQEADADGLGDTVHDDAMLPPVEGTNTIPEFPTIALPIAAILGLAFMFQHRKE